MVEHVDLTDPELHEPKGAASANDGEVYIADGLGAGSWGTITFEESGVETVILSDGDFPAAVSDTITLDSNTIYRIVGSIDINAFDIVLGNNSVLVGSDPKVDKITSTTAGTLITSSSGGRIKGLGLNCASGTALSLSGSSTQRISVTETIVESCTTVGSISGYGCAEVDIEVDSATTGGLSFTGSLGVAEVVMKSSSWTGTLVDLGTAVFDFIKIGTGGAYNTASGNTGISIAASSANIEADGLGIITGNRFSGAGTKLSGYTIGDTRWIVEDNSNVANTHREVPAASGGFEINNTSTGAGFERVLTTSDLAISSEIYTPSNVTTTRTYDANSTTLDEVADVLGTLLADLQALDIVQ